MDNKEKLLKCIVDNKLGKELAQLLYDTKKEVFDDIEKDKRLCITSIDMWNDLKKLHLSTFQKEMNCWKINCKRKVMWIHKEANHYGLCNYHYKKHHSKKLYRRKFRGIKNV